MYFQFLSKTSVLAAAVSTMLLCQWAVAQEVQSNAPHGPEASKGLPPRATPNDYQAHALAGTVTIAAEFDNHSIPDPQSTLTTQDYVVVEVALYGPPGARLRLNYQDFSLRVNGKKTPLAAQGYALVFKSLKDPEYEAPDAVKKEDKKGTSLNTGGGGQGAAPDSLPPIVHIPIAVTRGWEQRVQRASLPEGDRELPQAGLIFFERGGKTNSVELIYNGPAGKAALTLQP